MRITRPAGRPIGLDNLLLREYIGYMETLRYDAKRGGARLSTQPANVGHSGRRANVRLALRYLHETRNGMSSAALREAERLLAETEPADVNTVQTPDDSEAWAVNEHGYVLPSILLAEALAAFVGEEIR